jgi:putative ABC transport system permease protein
VDAFSRDLRHAVRQLVRNPGFALVAVLTMGVGIGATTAIFSAAYSVLLRPLPYSDPERLVAVWTSPQGDTTSKMTVPFADFESWQRSARSFSNLAAASWFRDDTVLSGLDAPRSLLGVAATSDFFRVLGIHALLGRTFDDGDLARGCAVVIAHRFWQTIGSDPRIVGATLRLSDQVCTVLGVMPASFVFYPEPTDLWILITPSGVVANEVRQSGVMVIGRLALGVDAGSATAELRGLSASNAASRPLTTANMLPLVNDLRQEFTSLAGRNLRLTLLVLLGAVACLFAIACMNVVNLLLGRATVRRAEFAIRLAIGGSRSRLMSQVVIESVVLSIAGAAIGAALAAAATRTFVVFHPVQLPPGADVRLNLPVLMFTVVSAVLAGVACGIVPAWRFSDPFIGIGHEVHDRALVRGKRQLLVRSLVVAQSALSVVLLVAAVLLMQSVSKSGSDPVGFEPAGLFSYRVVLPLATYSDPGQRAGFYRRLIDGLSADPAIRNVAISTSLPPRSDSAVGVLEREGLSPPDPRNSVFDVSQQAVSERYFDVMEVPLRQGRAFTERDDRNAEPVCIVNETLARKYFGSDDPIGRRIRFASPAPANAWLTIVGVVGDEKRADLRQELGWVAVPVMYRPLGQRVVPSVQLLMRPRGNLDARRVDRVVHGIDSGVLLGVGVPVASSIAEYFRFPQFRAGLLTVFASVALFLAVVGLYALLAQMVAHRKRDIGVRMALGASPSMMIREVMSDGLVLAGIGLVAGLLLLIPTNGLLKGLLYGVTAHDTATLVGVVTTLVLAALGASYIPAWRAARVDPVTALRSE